MKADVINDVLDKADKLVRKDSDYYKSDSPISYELFDAHEEWEEAGSPRVPDVPSDEALDAAADILEAHGTHGRAVVIDHDLTPVVDLLRSLRGA